jgi:hypothetical protein
MARKGEKRFLQRITKGLDTLGKTTGDSPRRQDEHLWILLCKAIDVLVVVWTESQNLSLEINWVTLG